MAKTKDFMSPPPPRQKSSGPKSVTKSRVVSRSSAPPPAHTIPDSGNSGMLEDSKTSQVHLPQAASIPDASQSLRHSDPRNTLVMKPGESPLSAEDLKPRAQKKYGIPAGLEQHTVVMPTDGAGRPRLAESDDERTAFAGASYHPQKSAPPPSRPAESASSMPHHQAPELEIVQHVMPQDAEPDSRLMLITNPDSEQAAAFRVLRHHVMERGNPQVIAVSGPHDGCGKTTTAINLAMALAESGRAEVLLVDANLRNPKVATIFRFVPPSCFSEELIKHREDPFSPWGVVEVSEINLHIAAINPRNEHPTRIDAPAFAVAMERLRLGPYRHIVVDCPSVIGNADVNLIQDATDGVVLAARTKSATVRDIRTAVDQLTPTKIIGTALFES